VYYKSKHVMLAQTGKFIQFMWIAC